MKLSVIVPTLNESATIKKTLDALSRLVNIDEIIVVDGGSSDETISIIENYKFNKPLNLVKTGHANRATQMHEGTRHASGDVFWFVHADTLPAQGCGRKIKKFMSLPNTSGGNFELIFDGESKWAKFLTKLYPKLRSIGLVYGDSAIFAKRKVYEKIKGFRDLPHFEDVDLYRRLSRKGDFVTINVPIRTSSRYFENDAFFGNFVKWSILQGLYRIGIPPRILEKAVGKIDKK
jgi:rSAM/selenodomain-associated transferase 2